MPIDNEPPGRYVLRCSDGYGDPNEDFDDLVVQIALSTSGIGSPAWASVHE